MTEVMLKAWIDATLKPLLVHAVKVMPLTTFATTLIGYGVACARGAGLTKDQVRAELERALSTYDVERPPS